MTSPLPLPADSGFPSTHWSVVRRARGSADKARSHEACKTLCEQYYYPVYQHLRRKGFPPEEAEELTQGFFTDFLARGPALENAVRKADDPDPPSFRSCLLTALKSYRWTLGRRDAAQKAGGGLRPASFDAMTPEERYRCEPAAGGESPDAVFVRAWAGEVLNQALQDVKASYDPARFDALKVYLTAADERPSYAETASRLKMTEAGVKKAVSRLRTAFAASVRTALAETVDGPAGVDDELRDLFGALAGTNK